MKPHVLDASALIGLFINRAFAPVVRRLLEQAFASGSSIYMSAVNWGEVYALLWKNHGQGIADGMVAAIAKIPVQVIDADQRLAKKAATLKVRFGLPYADAFAAALAIDKEATLVTSDRHFELVKGEVRLLRLHR